MREPPPTQPAAAPGGGRAILAAASYALVAALMTWPLVARLPAGDWLGLARPESREDYFNHVWNHWFLTTRGWRAPFGATDLLFFPEGFELGFHTLDLLHVALVGACARLGGWVTGFDLAGLLLLVLSALAARALVLDRTRDEWSAWFGGAVFAFTTWSLFHFTLHPDLMTLFPLPLAALGLCRAAERQDGARWAVIGGVSLAAAGYAGLYVLVVCGATLAALALALALGRARWRERRFWGRVALLVLVGAALLAPRLAPMIAGGELGGVLGQKHDPGSSVDLVRLVVPYGHPWLGPLRSRGLAGPDVSILVPIVPLVLAAVGIADRRHRREAALWSALGAAFLVLTVGSRLELAGRELAALPMPRDLLSRWIPLPFAAFRDSKLYFLGVLLPLAMAAAFGLRAALAARSTVAGRAALCAAAALLTLGEVHLGPFRPADLRVSGFYRELARQPGRGALVELPFGRPQSKRYLYYQTIHGRPIQEGSVSREAPRSRAFVLGNALLRGWWSASRPAARESLCAGPAARRLGRAAVELRDAGFELVVLHADAPAAIRATLAHLAPVHEEPALAVYRVADLAASPPCGAVPAAGQPM